MQQPRSFFLLQSTCPDCLVWHCVAIHPSFFLLFFLSGVGASKTTRSREDASLHAYTVFVRIFSAFAAPPPFPPGGEYICPSIATRGVQGGTNPLIKLEKRKALKPHRNG